MKPSRTFRNTPTLLVKGMACKVQGLANTTSVNSLFSCALHESCRPKLQSPMDMQSTKVTTRQSIHACLNTAQLGQGRSPGWAIDTMCLHSSKQLNTCQCTCIHVIYACHCLLKQMRSSTKAPYCSITQPSPELTQTCTRAPVS